MTVAYCILIFHYIGDFVLQDTKWAENKSKSNKNLVKHVFTYSTMWFFAVPILLYLDPSQTQTLDSTLGKAICFMIITFITHYITDYVTSRITNYYFRIGKFGTPIPNLGAFSVIGFDQLLHYTQLFITYLIITKVIVW